MNAIDKMPAGEGIMQSQDCVPLEETVHRAWSSLNAESSIDTPVHGFAFAHYAKTMNSYPLPARDPAQPQTVDRLLTSPEFSMEEPVIAFKEDESHRDAVVADHSGDEITVLPQAPLLLRRADLPLQARINDPRKNSGLSGDVTSVAPSAMAWQPATEIRANVRVDLVAGIAADPAADIGAKTEAAIDTGIRQNFPSFSGPAIPIQSRVSQKKSLPTFAASAASIRLADISPSQIQASQRALPVTGSVEPIIAPVATPSTPSTTPAMPSPTLPGAIAFKEKIKLSADAPQALLKPQLVQSTLSTLPPVDSTTELGTAPLTIIPPKEKSPRSTTADALPLAQIMLEQSLPEAFRPAQEQAKNTQQPKQQANMTQSTSTVETWQAPVGDGSTLTYRFDKWNGNHAVTVQTPVKVKTEKLQDNAPYILAPSDSVVGQHLSERLALLGNAVDVPFMQIADPEQRHQQKQQQQKQQEQEAPREDDEDAV